MSKEPSLFPDLPQPDTAVQPIPSRDGTPRVLVPQRNQIELRPVDLDATLAPEHPARAVWAFVEGLDLSALYRDIGSVEGRAGRAAIDPRILMALWLYATVDGVGSAREIERLTDSHDAYRWICGGVNVNHHTLSDFRCARLEVLERLLTHSVAVLLNQGLVKLERVAQDGMRVRASAGAASFRRRSRLERCMQEARAQVETLRGELDADPQASQRRRQAARLHAAEQRGRTRQAYRAACFEHRSRSAGDEDGRWWLSAYNVQFATSTDSQIIVGVDVSNLGSDLGQLTPMLDEIERHHGRLPGEGLVDGGYPRHEDIESADERGTTVYAPVPKPKDPTRDPHVPRPEDSAVIGRWRARMATAEAKRIYTQRAATAECVNAIARGRGLRQFLVRGLRKVKAVAVWYALAHNLMRGVALAAPA